MPVNTPSEVVDPISTIAAAENEASSLDILVCGNCQAVFHFVEEFQEHKSKNSCEKADKTSLNLQGSKKPQVWAFLIWKNSQQKAADQQGSWKLYQRWCNMPESQRQSWVTAGRNIQAFINLSHARELNKVDITNKDTDRDIDDEIEEDFVVEKIVGKRYNPKKDRFEYLLKWEGYPPEQNTWEPLSNLTTCKSLLQEYERMASQQVNNKSVSRLPGVLKKDNTPTSIKLSNTNAVKPSGFIPNKFSVVEKKNENTTGTLQTQRKIVPATPLTNSASVNKVTTPFVSNVRSDSNKLTDISKSTSSGEDVKEINKSSSESLSNIGENSKTPFKKRVISSAPLEEIKTPIIQTSPNDQKQKPADQVKDWSNVGLSEVNEILPIKRTLDTDNDSINEIKKPKLNDSSDGTLKSDNEEKNELPKSGIFKKSDLKEKFPSINNMFGKSNENFDDSNSKLEKTTKNNENQKGILKIDHTQIPELQSGIYKMSVKGGTVKVDLLPNDKNISAVLPTMPGPKGGVLILSNRFDLSKISKVSPKVLLSPEKVAIPKIESPAFRGIFPKNKVPEENSAKVQKPDFHSRSLSISDNVKKPVSSSLRKVLGGSLSRGKGRNNISSPSGISRFKPNYVKSYDASGSRHGDSDGFLSEFCDYDNSDMEEYSFPDDFPEELDMEPLSPTGPLTLDPETGKRLMRAEGEPTPEPTPEPSPEPSPAPSPVPTQVMCKEENEIITDSENIILKNDDSVEDEAYGEINDETYKVTTPGQVSLLPNVTYGKTENELKGISVAASLAGEESADNSNMLTITGEDGLVYQVANAKLEGDTIVVASGEDEQHCVFVTEDGHQVMQRTNEDGSTVLTLESAYADAVAQLVPNQVNILPDGSQIYVKQEENGQVELVQLQGTEIAENETAEEQEVQGAENGDENSGQVVAQLIEAGEPAPGGGPRRVVLLLPDGNLMVTEVDEEQFAALELEKD